MLSEEDIERHEEEAMRWLIADRASSAEFSRVDDTVWNDVIAHYEDTIAKRLIDEWTSLDR
jgi:hypothetical protein